MQSKRGPFEVKLGAAASAESELAGARQFFVEGANAVDAAAFEAEMQLTIAACGKTVKRDFDCNNYETCLGLAAALNWDSFTCDSCARKINPQLIWRAHQNIRQDKSLNQICDLPEIKKLISK